MACGLILEKLCLMGGGNGAYHPFIPTVLVAYTALVQL